MSMQCTFIQDHCHKRDKWVVLSQESYIVNRQQWFLSFFFFNNLMGLLMHMWPVVDEIFLVAPMLCLASPHD